ncbi:EamA family transporter [Bdellovibrio sp. qaytius]|nr:EamA family transporter [Bdellovibrio sp. qaytius]
MMKKKMKTTKTMMMKMTTSTKMKKTLMRTMKNNTGYFLTCAIIWGLTWIAIKYQLPYVDGSAAVFYRFIFSSSVMFIICLFTKVSLFKFTKAQHFRFATQGLFIFCLNYLLTYWATSMATSALIALAFTSIIFLNMFGARIFLNVPFEKKVVWGGILSLIGMACISLNEYLNIGLHPSSLWGFLIGLLSTVSASAGNLISYLNKKNNVPISANNSWAMLYGSGFSLFICFILGKSLHVDVTSTFVISFFYLSIFGTVISFWAYFKLIENIGPAKAAFTSIASPVIALGVSTYMEKLDWSIYLALGAVFCIMGNVVALVRLPQRQRVVVPPSDLNHS